MGPSAASVAEGGRIHEANRRGHSCWSARSGLGSCGAESASEQARQPRDEGSRRARGRGRQGRGRRRPAASEEAMKQAQDAATRAGQQAADAMKSAQGAAGRRCRRGRRCRGEAAAAPATEPRPPADAAKEAGDKAKRGHEGPEAARVDRRIDSADRARSGRPVQELPEAVARERSEQPVLEEPVAHVAAESRSARPRRTGPRGDPCLVSASSRTPCTTSGPW